jgi:hypothetical protein
MAEAATKTFDLSTMAEDVEDIVYNISPMDTWAFTNLKRKKATNRYHQWVTDALAAPAANSHLEGDDAVYTSATAATHVVLGNYTNISRKIVEVSGTADAVKQYGVAEKFAYEVAKVGKELKRDIEAMLLGAQASTIGAKATARVAAGLECMIAGNRILAGGANNTTGTTPGFSGTTWAAPTDGTQATLAENVLNQALQAAWEDGGDPSIILCGPSVKRQIAQFAGATSFAGFQNNQGRSLGAVIGGVDVYVSDFGNHKVMLSRYCRARTLFAVDPEYVSMAWLRPIKMETLAKVGDGTRAMMIGEWTLVADNPSAHAKVQDLVTSV